MNSIGKQLNILFSFFNVPSELRQIPICLAEVLDK